MREEQDPRQPLMTISNLAVRSPSNIISWTFDADTWPTFQEEAWEKFSAVEKTAYPLWTVMCIFSAGLCLPCILSQRSLLRRNMNSKYGRLNPAIHRCSLDVKSFTTLGETYHLQTSDAPLTTGKHNLKEAKLDMKRYPNGVQIAILSLTVEKWSSEVNTVTELREDVSKTSTLEIPVSHDQVKALANVLPEFCKGLTQRVVINIPV
ncbi:hypothetical protein PROFUN_14053 [Planoprotostelium fungivorum]|uniref:Uncharacterized protein n=1 Tax=Planoprotostelium fungivorum TaxID=1890364 RepID=A0A2P6N242_9EUKA|nr:hypothetical protein PROFUN_14053 [Planoprotostelium fungivorum]